MTALDYLNGAGLVIEAVAGKLRASPADRITPELRQFITAHKAELLIELAAANEAPPLPWLHLLALTDGRVIQRCGEQSTREIEAAARLQHGADLDRVIPVHGYDRALTEAEVAQALTGTLAAPPARPAASNAWLARVARLLGTQPAVLLEGGHLTPQDLVELAGSDADLVATAIRHSPAWICRPQQPDQPHAPASAETTSQQHRAVTAATASQAWREADAAHTSHLMGCRVCNAATGRYCPTGQALRQQYDRTPMEESR